MIEDLKERKELLYQVIAEPSYHPMKLRELAGLLQVPKEERQKLREILDILLVEGKISTDEKGRYCKVGSDKKTGVFSGTSRGFGFVTIEGMKEDIFIPENETKGALDKDIVQIVIKEEKTGKRKEGSIAAILKRSTDTVVGTFQKSKNYGFVVADNQKFGSDIFIAKEHTKGAVDGHKVLVKITDYGTNTKNPEGKVIEILGHINDPGVDVISVIKSNGLTIEFPEEVMKQISKIPEEINTKDMAGRVDLRELMTVTIDGEDAKDLDDAITISKNENGYKLGVHIADVSQYVTENSPLDKEALKRGTSVYLVDRVIPMLPHKLSNGICSLNAGCDRLALSCLMDIDKKGNVVGHRIAETIIRVDKRMSYTSVKKIIEENDEEECEKYKEQVPMFQLMEELASILREKRKKRGSIDFDFPESKIYVDEVGRPIEILPYERNKATKIIEDFMLIANETVAEDFFWQELPFVYRSHETPDPEKIQKLSIFIHNFGYSMHIKNETLHPKELQKLLAKTDGTKEEALISRLALRSMKQARYTTDCDGHFGLAAKYYCHFTSPIRRYPDLQIHRIIKENLHGELTQKRQEHYYHILDEVAKQSSMTERRADEAEREVEKLKKVEYMSQFLGEKFEGVISGITSWGMYIELPNTVEGMVRLSELTDDFYIYDEEHVMLIGEHTKRTYKLGEKIKIEVIATDKLLKTIDFLPVIE